MNISDLQIPIDRIDLFRGMDDYAVERVLTCMEAYKREYEKNSVIYHIYDPIEYAGIVLCGQIELHMYSSEGNDILLNTFHQGKTFGSAYACMGKSLNPVEVKASVKSTILFLKVSKLFTPKAVSCQYASAITTRILKSTAKQCVFQNQKIQILSQKQLRSKVVMYIRIFGGGANKVALPFDRQDFANFLNADRSALSRELCRMKEDGLIDFDKREITLLESSYFQGSAE